MNDLLKEFCKVAPKEWGARRFDEPISHAEVKAGDIGIMVEGAALLIRLTDDRASAEAIIFLWDWLEEQGVQVCLESTRPGYADEGGIGGPYICSDALYDTPAGGQPPVCGKTRIEALVRAVVAVRKETK